MREADHDAPAADVPLLPSVGEHDPTTRVGDATTVLLGPVRTGVARTGGGF